VEDNAFMHAAALGFYTLFSLAPIFLVALALAGAFLGPEAARGEIQLRLTETLGPESARAVEAAIMRASLEEGTFISSVIGISLLVFGATTLFAQLQLSLNLVWGVAPKPSRSGLLILLQARVLSLALVLAIGCLLILSLALSTALSAAIRFADETIPLPPIALRGMDLFVSLTVFTILFALILKILPDVHLRWRHVWLSGLVTATLFVIGRSGIAFYLATSGMTSTYGAAGSLVAVLLWVYYSSLILIFGAEFTKNFLAAHDLPIVPKRSAVLVRKELVEIDRPNI
jgi:membrane protein